jgi:hypothetical protein
MCIRILGFHGGNSLYRVVVKGFEGYEWTDKGVATVDFGFVR